MATRYALYYQGQPRELEPWQRMGWEQVERVEWNADRADLTFIGHRPRTEPALVLQWKNDRTLLDLTHERIAATTLLHVPLSRSGQAAGWLTARRPAGGNGDIRWVLHAVDIKLTDDEIAQAIRNARAQAGI